MAIKLKTMMEDGLGTEAKIIWCDAADEFPRLRDWILAGAYAAKDGITYDEMQFLEALKACKTGQNYTRPRPAPPAGSYDKMYADHIATKKEG